MKRSEFMERNFLDEDQMSSIENRLMLYFGRPTEHTYDKLDSTIQLHHICGMDIVRLVSYPSQKMGWFESLDSFLAMVGRAFDKGLNARTFWNAVNKVIGEER